MYFTGMGVEKNMKKAVSWWEKAVAQGEKRAQFSLGLCLIDGNGIGKDPERGIKLIELSAQQGEVAAQHYMGLFCAQGTFGMKKDMEKAISWWEKAASQNNPASLCILAQIYEEGIHKPRNEEMFLQLYRKAAEGGDAIAQNALGHFYTLGLHGFPKDPKLAFQWTLKSAEQGNSSAMVNLGYFYEVGDGSTDPKRVFDRPYGIVPRDYDKAAEWYEKAAVQGHVRAHFYLATIYRLKSDDKKYMEYLARAANLGDPEAQFEIANTFQSIGDRKSAVTWLMKAAEQGFTRAQVNLGYCYEMGDGVAKDLDKAAEWYNKAANLRNGEAKYLLNKLLEKHPASKIQSVEKKCNPN